MNDSKSGPEEKQPPTLMNFFAGAAADFLAVRTALAAYDTTDPISPEYSAQTRFSLCLRLRMAAATTAIAGQMLDAGRGGMVLDRWSVEHGLLGGQATQFRIYERNLEHDAANAEQAIRNHAPQLLAA